jgi:hypothetical protein
MKRLLVIAVLVAACGSNPPSPSGSAGPAATPGNPVASDAVQPSASAGTAFVGEFPPITMQGKGTQSVTFTIPDDAIAIAALSHPAKGTFTVTALDETGKATKTLVKTNGKYSGTVLFDLDTHSVGFRVQSKGPWKIIVLPAEAAKAWDGTKLTRGAGDAVLRRRLPVVDAAHQILVAEVDLPRVRARHARHVARSRAHRDGHRIAAAVVRRRVAPVRRIELKCAAAGRTAARPRDRVAHRLQPDVRHRVLEVDLEHRVAVARQELHLDHVHVRRQQHLIGWIHELRVDALSGARRR